MAFQIHALSPVPFQSLFKLPAADLAGRKAALRTADARPGYPCRVSLQDAEVGETLLLVNYVHQAGDSPFHASHAIYVRDKALQSFPAFDVVPDMFAGRLVSIRAFDEADYMVSASVMAGDRLDETIALMLEVENTSYLHLHNAALGCYLARVTRAGDH